MVGDDPAPARRPARTVVADTLAVAEEWNAAACAAKGYDTSGPEGGEELFGGIGTFVTWRNYSVVDAGHRALTADRATPGRSCTSRASGSRSSVVPAIE